MTTKTTTTNEALRELHLFAGAGGGIQGGQLCGHRTVCAVEIDSYCRDILLARQRDGLLPRFPVWDDICTFDGRPWRGQVEVVAGGFPCQDITASGRGAGITGERSGLWKEMARVIGEVRPRHVFVENSPMLVQRGLTTVVADLTELGYDSRWCIIGADHAGAPHQRRRLWLVANRQQLPNERTMDGTATSAVEQYLMAAPATTGSGNAATAASGRTRGTMTGQMDASSAGRKMYPTVVASEVRQGYQNRSRGKRGSQKSLSTVVIDELGGREVVDGQLSVAWTEWLMGWQVGWTDLSPLPPESVALGWHSEHGIPRVEVGQTNRQPRLKALGNGQVPQAAALAWQTLTADDWT